MVYVGYNEKEKSNMKKKLQDTLDKKETEHLIELKNKPMEILQIQAAKDIKQVSNKLDKIEDMVRTLHDRNR